MSPRLTPDAERQLARSLEVLGLKLGASEPDVETAYFIESRILAAQDTPEAKKQKQRIDKAFRFIKVSYRFAKIKIGARAVAGPEARAVNGAVVSAVTRSDLKCHVEGRKHLPVVELRRAA